VLAPRWPLKPSPFSPLFFQATRNLFFLSILSGFFGFSFFFLPFGPIFFVVWGKFLWLLGKKFFPPHQWGVLIKDQNRSNPKKTRSAALAGPPIIPALNQTGEPKKIHNFGPKTTPNPPKSPVSPKTFFF